MKRTSWTPILAMVALSALCALIVVGGDDGDRGREGPQIEAGIVPPDKRPFPDPGPAALGLAVRIDPTNALAVHLPGARQFDQRSGLEEAPWQAVAVVAEDGRPLTRSVSRALAELLTRQVPVGFLPDSERYPLVMLLPEGEEAMPMPVDRILRVATAGEMPAHWDEAFSAAVTIVQGPARPGDDHAGLLPAPAVADRVVVVAVDGDGGDGRVGDWPTWHATVARAVAELGLAELLADSAVVSRHRLDPTAERGAWPSGLPPRPEHRLLRWHAAYQAPLARGWTGLITGTEATKRSGRTIDTGNEIGALLEKGGWAPVPGDEAGVQTWQRSPEDGRLDQVRLYPVAGGWQVWATANTQQPRRLVATWLDAADRGDRSARALIRRHLAAPGLGDDLARIARRVLARDCDPFDLAILAQMAPTDSSTAAAGRWLRWVAGREDGPEPPGRERFPVLEPNEHLAELPKPRAWALAGGGGLIAWSDSVHTEAWLRDADGPRRLWGSDLASFIAIPEP